MTDTSDLDAQMLAAGMVPLSKMLSGMPMDAFRVHASVTNLVTFSKWLDMRHEEMLKLRINLELKGQQDNEMYEWALAHAAAFGEVAANFRAATNLIQN
ncbi:hypothetical protein R6242_21580 [Iodobacter sp. CM08]|uniref:hypothetical protein n=1 Tax=Iodobacter sp. CM08 TaxID=3085902 RepID=UPI002980D9DC|nr:hypothetical protein [Iodobacter sp. CM08]MDW5419169.1 hypothetical protein [Iodobacter sp. CM08]